MLSTGSQIGKYLLGKKLGQGGFGVVFRAHDTSLDREVALKFLHAEHTATPQILQRFLQEARSAARVAHPGIVTVFECGQIDDPKGGAAGVAYIAMELLAGESLTDRLARSGRFVPGVAMEITRQVASALEAAHRAGIVHRDLKPDNIFLVKDPAVQSGERVKVLDFGIAKLGRAASSSVQTQSMMVFGTPRYMSPEQCKSAAHVDHRSDIYTLGCILFELVTGRPPFAGEPGELIAQHLLVAPPLASSVIGDIPPPLDQLVTEMLAKDPGARPPTMAAVQRALESGGAFSPGVAPTLLPDAIESLPRITPLGPLGPQSLGVRPPVAGGPAIAASSPTTLGAATGASVVTPGRTKRWFATIAGALVVAGIAAAIGFGIRPGDDESATRPAVAAEAAPPAGSRTPEPPPPAPAPTEPTPAEPTPAAPTAVEAVEPRPAASRGRSKPAAGASRTAATGRLVIRSKPEVDIVIDGEVRGRSSRRGLRLSAGRHRVMLVEAALGIEDRFVVEIKPGATETIVRDYQDRVPAVDEPPGAKPAGKGKDKTINPFAKGAGSR